MRVPAALIALTMCMPATAAEAPSGTHAQISPREAAPASERGTAECRRTTNYLAGGSSLFQGKPLKPQKLTELPPGIAYMAVYRHIGACEDPLTMVDYRNPRRR